MQAALMPMGYFLIIRHSLILISGRTITRICPVNTTLGHYMAIWIITLCMGIMLQACWDNIHSLPEDRRCPRNMYLVFIRAGMAIITVPYFLLWPILTGLPGYR